MRPICSFIQNPPAIPLYFFFVGKMRPQDNQKWVVKHVTWSCRNIGYALWRCYFDRALKFLQTGGQLTRLCTLTETPLVSVWKVLRWLLDLQQQVRFFDSSEWDFPSICFLNICHLNSSSPPRWTLPSFFTIGWLFLMFSVRKFQIQWSIKENFYSGSEEAGMVGSGCWRWVMDAVVADPGWLTKNRDGTIPR